VRHGEIKQASRVKCYRILVVWFRENEEYELNYFIKIWKRIKLKSCFNSTISEHNLRWKQAKVGIPPPGMDHFPRQK